MACCIYVAAVMLLLLQATDLYSNLVTVDGG